MSKEVFAAYVEDVNRVQEFYDTFSFSLDKVPSDGGWTASQCLAHICDAEISLSLRIRMILTTDSYQFSSWDEDAFAAIKVDRYVGSSSKLHHCCGFYGLSDSLRCIYLIHKDQRTHF